MHTPRSDEGRLGRRGGKKRKKKTTHNPERKVYAKLDKQKADRSIELARVGGIPAKWKAIDGKYQEKRPTRACKL